MFDESQFYKIDKSWLTDSCRNSILINKCNVCDIRFEYYTINNQKDHMGETLLKIHVTTVNSDINLRKYFDDLMSAEVAVQNIFGDFVEL